MSKEHAIIVEGLSKKYKIGKKLDPTLRGTLKNMFSPSTSQDFWALDEVSFEVKKGQAVGVIGRNGAGKSTLLKILSKITYPTKGRALLNGRLSSLLEVGTGFHPELTGRENIYLNGSLLGMTNKEINSNLDDIIDFSGVSQFIDTPVKRYSSGMYTRLAFSVAAHLDTEILIIDEVLSVGDIDFQKKCLGKIDNVRSSGRSILFVSHNLEHIKTVCDSVILLDKGQLIKKGPAESMIDLYKSTSHSSTFYFKGPLANQLSSFYFMINAIDVSKEKLISIEPQDHVDIEVKILGNVKRIKLYLALFTSKNERLLTINSNRFVEIDGTHIENFRIPKLTLRPGAYRVAIGGLEEDYLGSDWLWNENAFTFHISPTWNSDYQELNDGLINLPYDS